jgi:hypothetical protein
MSKKTEQLFKVLVGGSSCHGGDLGWPLPTKTKPGKWVEISGDLQICRRGIHLTKEPTNWLKVGCSIYEAEAKGIAKWEGDKCVCSSARLVREVEVPAWWKKSEAFIATIKDVPWMKNAEPEPQWRVFDTRDAAWNAARDAARAAAGNAAGNAARNAARDAARDAAGDAAWNAARDAAGDAAWNAARDAAGDAARDAAWNAARDAAWNAAGDAAWDAAWECLVNHLCADLKLAKKHRTAMSDRWKVWTSGYGLYAEVGGVFYVYRKV